MALMQSRRQLVTRTGAPAKGVGVYSGFHSPPASAAGRSGAPSLESDDRPSDERSVALGRRTGRSGDAPMLDNRHLPWGNCGHTAAFRKVVLSESNVSRAGDCPTGSAY